MSSQSDEFQVLLPSNVKCNPRNKPNLYETELAKPLDLPNKWDVALINISDPHNLTNLDKSYQVFLLRRQLDTEDEPSNFLPNAENDQNDLYDVIKTVNVFIRTWEVDRGAKITRGNYDISKILDLIESQFHMVFTNKIINLRMDPYQYRVEINSNVNFAIAWYAERSILKLVGFEPQLTVIKLFKSELLNIWYLMQICMFKHNCLHQFN